MLLQGHVENSVIEDPGQPQLESPVRRRIMGCEEIIMIGETGIEVLVLYKNAHGLDLHAEIKINKRIISDLCVELLIELTCSGHIGFAVIGGKIKSIEPDLVG
jgi:hypothetical protein